MSQGHVHLEYRCPHGTLAGGCKCMIRPGEEIRFESSPCPPDCPTRLQQEQQERERFGNWMTPEPLGWEGQ